MKDEKKKMNSQYYHIAECESLDSQIQDISFNFT